VILKEEFSHLKEDNQVNMVDVGDKQVTTRVAIAESLVRLDQEIVNCLSDGDIRTKKGAVFQTAILAGIMGVKKTSDLIPLCHPLAINKVDIDISIIENHQVKITCLVRVDGKTGVEMEALTGASIAALTIYDMCKAMSHEIEIIHTRLIKKTGGKRDFERTS
jgi:cyclic pyranopterin phosphate synthase